MERRNLLNRPKITQAVNIPQLAYTIDVFVYYSDPICQRYLVSDGVVFADWINEEYKIFRKRDPIWYIFLYWGYMYISVFFMLL